MKSGTLVGFYAWQALLLQAPRFIGEKLTAQAQSMALPMGQDNIPGTATLQVCKGAHLKVLASSRIACKQVLHPVHERFNVSM